MPSTKEIIFNAIKKSDPPYVTIIEIAEKTSFARDTVSKYFHILNAEGKIKMTKKMGKIKLYEATE